MIILVILATFFSDYNETYEHVKVNLICNKTKRGITEASFVQDPDNVWVSEVQLITHKILGKK